MDLSRSVTAGAVAQRGQSLSVVLEVGELSALLAPVQRRQDGERRRGDVPVALEQLGQAADASDGLVACCGEAVVAPLASLTVVASVAAPLLAQMRQARRRAEEALLLELRTPEGVFRSTLMSTGASRGRQVGRQGGC